MMNTPLRVRPAEESDLASIVSIERQVFSMPWPPAGFLHEMKGNPHSKVIAADIRVGESWKLGGYLVYWVIAGEAQIGNIAVDPEFQQRGVGRALLRDVLEMLQMDEVESVTLEVRESNTAARALYSSFSFQEVGRRPGYYFKPQEDAILMTRFLTTDKEEARDDPLGNSD